MNTQLLETPAVTAPLPPSHEVIGENIKRAEEAGYITALGADALQDVNPLLAKAVIESSKSMGQAPSFDRK